MGAEVACLRVGRSGSKVGSAPESAESGGTDAVVGSGGAVPAGCGDVSEGSGVADGPGDPSGAG